MKRFTLGILVCFMLLSVCIPRAWAGEFIYVPDDKIGAFRIYIDDLRTLHVSWYVMNILGFWPGI